MRSLRDINTGHRLTESERIMWGVSGSNHAGIYSFTLRRGEVHVIVSSDGGWDHVSVSGENRCPTWNEMEFIKRIFFKEDETAMQLHVPPSDHINCNPFVLHMWRPLNELTPIPRPPASMV